MASSCKAPEPGPQKPNIILISLDTLRKDHLGLYDSNPSNSTPYLDRFADSAIAFEQAFAPVPFTLPSHLSVFTGLYPDVHRVERLKLRLSERIVTLPELLQNSGFYTAAVVTTVWMKGKFGFSRGFDRYEEIPLALSSSAEVNRMAEEILDARDAAVDQPLFLFLHFFDAHSDFPHVTDSNLPYYSQNPCDDAVGSGQASGGFCDETGHCATEFLQAANRAEVLISDSKHEQIKAQYRCGVSDLDRQLGALFQDLAERGIWDESIVILIADHGEEFLEHGRYLHAQPYVESLAVPLLIKLPGGKGGGVRRSQIVELIDLFPTILELIQIEIPSHSQGTSIGPILEIDTPTESAALGKDKLIPGRYSLRTANYTLIKNRNTGQSELYDRHTDTQEIRDISHQMPETTRQMETALEQVLDRNARLVSKLDAHPVRDDELVTEQEQDTLRALGYLN